MTASDNAILKVSSGAVIVREGETDSRAFNILSGRVEVYKEALGSRAVLAELGPGHFFGEMNLVLESARSASVRALEDCTLAVITPETFNQLLTRDPRSALPIVRALFERLRETNAKYMSLIAAQPAGRIKSQPAPASPLTQNPPVSATAKTASISLSGETPKAQKAIGGKTVALSALPFRIGRKVEGASADVLSVSDLGLDDAAPFTISRNHCAVDRIPSGGFFVIDRGSTLGTTVNGMRLGAQASTFQAQLNSGRNSLILGRQDSPYRFFLEIKA